MEGSPKIDFVNTFWEDFETDEEFDLVYYDPYEIIETTYKVDKFKFKHKAYMFAEKEIAGGGFWFEINGKEYFQPLQKI